MTSQDSASKARLETLEKRRVELQSVLDGTKSQAERNRLGQFATPEALAVEIVRAANDLNVKDPIRFLDPAFGTGAFYYALLSTLGHDRIAVAHGYEIDPQYGIPTEELWRADGLILHLSDFTKANPPKSEKERYNLIICNPPYVRHHHLSAGEKDRLRHRCHRICSGRIDGLSGLYCYFLVSSHDWLAEGGLGIWLVPSEFMDVNYGSWIKNYLCDRVDLIRIHRFDPNDVQFGDALVSSSIVFFRKQQRPATNEVNFTLGNSLERPRREKKIPLSTLRSEKKWTRFPVSDKRKGSGYVLGDFFVIKRGLATGDNSYFILTAERIRELGLPKRFLRPILPSPRHIMANEVRADRDGVPLTQPQMFLLDCRLPEEQVRDSYPKLWDYLEHGKARGLDARYLCRHRSPWYAQEDRPAAPFISTYMGRSDGASGTPFRFIRNNSKATAANVYLLMYPKGVLMTALQSRPELADRVWSLLNLLKPHLLLEEGRVYGGGLHKLEPRELANVPADQIAELLRLPRKNAEEQLRLLS